MSSEENLPKVAFLGPLGTYSHQCARNYFGENVEYVDYPTITKVFQSVGPEVPYALVPQENTIYGAVIETYDTLRLPEVGVDKFVRGERAISIQHCLVVRQGVQLKDVVKIVSHEQAFGQCTRFLQDNFPNAILEKRPSTAEAAQSLLTPEDDLEGERAAICSSVCTTIFDGLEVARSSIQNESENYTRFYVLSSSLRSTPPKLPSKPQLRRALVRIGLPAISNPSESSSRLTHHRPLHLLVSTLLTSLGVPVTRIDRRPSLNPVPFEDVYFIELEELGTPLEYRSKNASPSSVSEGAWLNKVQTGVDRVKSAGLDAALIGLW